MIHGECHKTAEHRAWRHIINRCYLLTDKDYPDYGGRGITVCKAWRRSYLEFLRHVGRRPSPKHSIERMNNALGYMPGNVRWATAKEQARNRRSSRLLNHEGQTHSLAEWAELKGVAYSRFHKRLKRGWSMEEALIKEDCNHGESRPNSKLTEEMVARLRMPLKRGELTLLAHEFGVAVSTAHNARTGQHWKHTTD